MRTAEKHVSPLTRIAVVGMGQTGKMFFEQLLPLDGMDTIDISRSNWEELQTHRPQLVIASVPNPADEAFRQLAATLPHDATVMLPQNGVDVIPAAQRIFPPETRLVRASLLTAVSSDEKGYIHYRTDKKIIGLAPVNGRMRNVRKLAKIFAMAGFRTRVYENARSMEITKLLLNTIGATSTVTGLTPLETFQDNELFSLELHGLMDRLNVLHRAKKELVNFPGYPYVGILDKLTGLLQHAPRPVRENMLPGLAKLFQELIASMIAEGRSNLPSAAARAIRQGRKTEVRYYHQPFVELSQTGQGGGCPLDEAILEIVSGQENGELHPDLNEMDADGRRQLLLDTYRAHIRT